MSRSKSRSGSIDIGHKNHYSSVFSRTFSASKLCRGDDLGSQIDLNALKSNDKKPPKVSNSSENRINQVITMQQRMEELEEELKRTNERLSLSEIEKNRVIDQLGAANMKIDESLSSKKELEHLKLLLSNSREESKIKDKKIENLESELGKVRKFELDLAEKDALMDKLKEDLRTMKEKEKDTMALLSENKRRIQELEAQIEREKQAESKMVDSLVIQTKQLEATKIELEESKVEISSFRDKIESSSKDNGNLKEEEIRNLKFELQMAQERETKASSEAKSLLEELGLLKNELKLAIEAEEKSTKAMEDLALALTEVATEANLAKEKVVSTQIELEHVTEEAEQLKAMVRATEERYQKLFDEAKKEADLYKNTTGRLRLEAEETLLAWNGKEMGFVSCIKQAEEERAIIQHENKKLVESLKAAENMTRAAREETYKLRDILKQAVNEANASKAAAGIARDENSQLKDCLAEKEETLHFLSRENERLRINEAAAHENVKEFKKLLSKTKDNEQNGIPSSPEGHKIKVMNKTFSFNTEDLKFMNEVEDESEKVLDEDPMKAEALKGSIFDANAETPKSEAHTPKSRYSEDYNDQLDSEQYDDSDSDRNSSHKGVRTMFRRVGDLLMIRRSSVQRKETISNA
ncbi:hypothetical protein ACJIZ3_002549 [Penstemon smallii]|uniref:Uncharacterized protein n=1 Tax=Penstemon smallii TaxID=265156 RepID=A0ABD3U8L1_9LAMI